MQLQIEVTLTNLHKCVTIINDETFLLRYIKEVLTTIERANAHKEEENDT